MASNTSSYVSDASSQSEAVQDIIAEKVLAAEDDPTPEGQESDLEPIVATHITRSVTARQKSLRAVTEPPKPSATRQKSFPVSEPPKARTPPVTASTVNPETFVTPYHGRQTFEISNYDSYNFRRTRCIVTPDGEVLLQCSDLKEVVVVHKNWADYRNKRLGPVGGYLGKGSRKWAFKGHTVNGELALFHLGGLHYYSGVTDSFNRAALTDELKSLVKAQYHLDIFKKRAQHYGVILPRIRYNTDGAFLGEVLQNNNDPPLPSFGSPDTRTMLYDTFLAAPFLDMKDNPEIRFTNRDGYGCRDDEHDDMDDVLAAFTHLALVDSDHTVIVTDIQGIYEDDELVLYDPQIHTLLGNWDDNDEGWKIINRFLRQHKCNMYCNKLRLEGASPESLTPRPLRRHSEPLGKVMGSQDLSEERLVLPPLHTLYPGQQSPNAVPVVLAPLMTNYHRSNGHGPLRIGFSPTK
ncbi:hypothetical protein M422DRAFT_249481 [Sphaerobolus stellatus SS14]|uniref:Alpha-type protein kinase domain-containing protein n=1 Tax=Sphaerobolus stellatus (strain SS14) TaxID=990650 RepID=A0A0C9VHK3_SPHS4|nr:hypothetical protein M422DRAFT_249481 [Sphaerobolus stellatus SS14]